MSNNNKGLCDLVSRVSFCIWPVITAPAYYFFCASKNSIAKGSVLKLSFFKPRILCKVKTFLRIVKHFSSVFGPVFSWSGNTIILGVLKSLWLFKNNILMNINFNLFITVFCEIHIWCRICILWWFHTCSWFLVEFKYAFRF